MRWGGDSKGGPPGERKDKAKSGRVGEGEIYVLFGRKVRFLGYKQSSPKGGFRQFNVEYLDDPNDIDVQSKKGEIASHGYWQLHRLKNFE